MTDQSIYENLDEDIDIALEQICERFFNFHENSSAVNVIDKHDNFLRYLGAIEAVTERHGVKLTMPNLEGDKRENIQMVLAFFGEIYEASTRQAAQKKIGRAKESASNVLQQLDIYEFEDDDFQRVQVLISEIRTILSESDQIEEEFKSRLLRRLEKLQSEMHKKVSDLDKFWGLVGDAGVALGKFGKDAEPLVKRISEIADIVWRTQTKAENLPPSASPLMLSNPKDAE